MLGLSWGFMEGAGGLKNSQRKKKCWGFFRVLLGGYIGPFWALWGPCWGHVGAMFGLCVTYVGPMLVHVGLLGGHVGDILSPCCAINGLFSEAWLPSLKEHSVFGICQGHVGPTICGLCWTMLGFWDQVYLIDLPIFGTYFLFGTNLPSFKWNLSHPL